MLRPWEVRRWFARRGGGRCAQNLAYWQSNLPCRAACPVNTNAGGYVSLIAQGRYREAYLFARAPNLLASICGRVCAPPCEAACRRAQLDEPMAIRAMKRFVTEQHGVESAASFEVRRYSLSATYSQMNMSDLFLQVLTTPLPPVSIRADLHRLTLPQAADRWYFGSGATQDEGRIFGFGTRSSAGASDLGTVVEGSADVRVRPRWTIGGYLGSILGGEVVTRTFAGSPALRVFGEHAAVLKPYSRRWP